MNNKAIAVLDTGAGGLSIVAILRDLAPQEELAYLADYAHLPYGLKSPELIKILALKAVKKLVEKAQPKILVIACHTISVLCQEDIIKELNIPVIFMLKPSINGLKNYLANKPITSLGIISTKATLSSGAYQKSWDIIDPQSRTKLIEHACGPLVALIEEEVFDIENLKYITEYLLPSNLKNSDAVMLGCTHFCAIKPILAKILKPGAEIINPAEFVVTELLNTLASTNNLAEPRDRLPIRCYVSDNLPRFKNVASRFIAEDLVLELVSTT